MAFVTTTTAKSYFDTGDKPTAAQFTDIIDTIYRRGYRTFTAETTVSSDDEGLTLICEASATCTVRLPSQTMETLAQGFQCHVRQRRSGEVVFATETGDSLVFYGSAAKIETQNGEVSIDLETASAGGNVYFMKGDVAQ